MDAADNLLASRPEVAFRAASVLRVIGVGEDGKSVVVTDEATETTMPCLDGYGLRTPGDMVLAVQLAGGAWVVLGRLGAEATSLAALQETVASIPAVNVTWGDGPPSGSGWKSGSTVYARDDGDGDRTLYINLGAADPDPPPVTKPPKKRTATVSASDQGGWRESSSQSDDEVKAGAWTGSDWYGAWFFGTDIEDAVAGRSVSKMTLTIARKDDTSGWNRGVPIHLGLHNRTTRGRPTITNKWNPGIKLSRGEADTITLPATQRDRLASGSSRGIAIYGSGRNDYAAFSARAVIRITF